MFVFFLIQRIVFEMDFTVPLIQFLSLIILFKILAFFSEDRDSVVALGTSGFIIFFKLLPLIINSVNNFSLALSLIVSYRA